MSGRPDYADRGGEPARMRPRHSACLCGGSPICTCQPLHTPSPGWRPWSWRPLMGLIFGYLQVADRKLDAIKEELIKMGEATAAALAELNKDLHRLADGYVALQAKDAALEAENADLRAALESADADKAAAIASALAADDAVDAQAIADADAIVEGLSPEPAPEPAPEEPPADGS